MARSQLARNTPQTPVAAPYKISRRECVAPFEKSESKVTCSTAASSLDSNAGIQNAAASSFHTTQPKNQMKVKLYAEHPSAGASRGRSPSVLPIKEQIDEMTAAILLDLENDDDSTLFLNEKMTLKSRDKYSTLLSRSTWDEDTSSLDETVRYAPVWKTSSQSFASTSSASIKKSVALLPAILSFVSCEACQDNDSYRYDDAFTTQNMSFRSLPVDDETVLAEDLSERDKSPLKASRDRQVIPREVALVNSFSSEMHKEGENHSLLGISSEDINHHELSHPPENSISHALEASKRDKESLPPRPKSSSIVSGTFIDGKDAAVNITPTTRGSERLLISLSFAKEVSAENNTEYFVESKQSGGATAHELSQPKGCTFNLTKVSYTFDEQRDEDCDVLAGGARNERPVVGASGSQINGKTTEQPNAVDTDANSSQMTMKAKGWKLAGEARDERPVVGSYVSQISGKATEQPIAVDTDANSSRLTMKAKGWKFDLTNFLITSITFDGENAGADAECQALIVNARSGGQVQEEPVEATPTLQGADQPYEEPVHTTPTLQDADQSGDQMVSEGIFETKKKGWKGKWWRRGK